MADSCFAKKTGFSGYIYKFRDVIIITFLGTQQQQFRAFLVFIQVHIMMYLMMTTIELPPKQWGM